VYDSPSLLNRQSAGQVLPAVGERTV